MGNLNCGVDPNKLPRGTTCYQMYAEFMHPHNKGVCYDNVGCFLSVAEAMDSIREVTGARKTLIRTFNIWRRTPEETQSEFLGAKKRLVMRVYPDEGGHYNYLFRYPVMVK